MINHIVMAGNFQQAKDYAEEHGWPRREWTFVGSPYCIQGLTKGKNPDLQLHQVGKYWEKSDDEARKAQELLRIAGFTEEEIFG